MMGKTVAATLISVGAVSVVAALTRIDRLYAFWLRGPMVEYRLAFSACLAITLVVLASVRPRFIFPTSSRAWIGVGLSGGAVGLIVQILAYLVYVTVVRPSGFRILVDTFARFGAEAIVPALLSGGWIVGATAAVVTALTVRAMGNFHDRRAANL